MRRPAGRRRRWVRAAGSPAANPARIAASALRGAALRGALAAATARALIAGLALPFALTLGLALALAVALTLGRRVRSAALRYRGARGRDHRATHHDHAQELRDAVDGDGELLGVESLHEAPRFGLTGRPLCGSPYRRADRVATSTPRRCGPCDP